jgi:hypothetical protein
MSIWASDELFDLVPAGVGFTILLAAKANRTGRVEANGMLGCYPTTQPAADCIWVCVLFSSKFARLLLYPAVVALLSSTIVVTARPDESCWALAWPQVRVP